MRRLFMVTCVLLLVTCAPAVGFAQTVTAAAQAKIARILAHYPEGGPGLADAIAAAVEADPSLAAAAVLAAQTANSAQQAAIGTGLAMAVAALNSNGTAAGQAAAQAIEQDMASAPPGTLAAFSATIGGTLTAFGVGGGGALGPNISTNACVSPSRPGAGC